MLLAAVLRLLSVAATPYHDQKPDGKEGNVSLQVTTHVREVRAGAEAKALEKHYSLAGST